MDIIIDSGGNCVGCGTCVEVCPGGVLELKDDKAVVVNKGECTECKACEVTCEYEAIKIIL